MVTILQPKESYTIKELTEIFSISRQALSKHIEKLDKEYIAKNSRGYRVILPNGVKKLAEILDKNELLEQLRVKDNQIEKLNSLLNQQQQLQLNTQKILEEKQNLLKIKDLELEKTNSKKWYQFWK